MISTFCLECKAFILVFHYFMNSMSFKLERCLETSWFAWCVASTQSPPPRESPIVKYPGTILSTKQKHKRRSIERMLLKLCTVAAWMIWVSHSVCARHTSNYALIVDTSMFWFNYRHIANSLAVYRAVKAGGIPDSNIILMLGEDIACSARNSVKGSVFDDDSHSIDLFDEHVQVDYRGEEVTVENVLRVLSGRHLKGTPKSKRLDSDENSNVLLYFAGHGGDGFLKFRDTTTMSAPDIADALAQMKAKGRFKELLFVVDTCQASTLFEHFNTPDIVAIGSSVRGESSYSHTHDSKLGVAVIDRFTYYLLRYFERSGISGSLKNLFDSFDRSLLLSTVFWSSSLSRAVNKVPASDFFGAVLDIEGSNATYSESLHTTDPVSEVPEAADRIQPQTDSWSDLQALYW